MIITDVEKPRPTYPDTISNTFVMCKSIQKKTPLLTPLLCSTVSIMYVIGKKEGR